MPMPEWMTNWKQDDPPSRYEQLTAEEQATLQAWIAYMIVPAQKVYDRYTSYALKGFFERSRPVMAPRNGVKGFLDLGYEGFYITNGQFKGAMLAAGYQPANANELNWRFRINVPYDPWTQKVSGVRPDDQMAIRAAFQAGATTTDLAKTYGLYDWIIDELVSTKRRRR